MPRPASPPHSHLPVLGRLPAVAVTAGIAAAALALSLGCSTAKPGPTGAPLYGDVTRSLGEPAMQWKYSSGSRQLAYTTGPAGLQTYMVYLRSDGSLIKIEGVRDREHFAMVVRGQTDRSSIERLLGPPQERVDLGRPREQVWVWRFKTPARGVGRFVVIFDTTTWRVKQAFEATEPGARQP